MLGILFKGEKIITSAQAIERHQHDWEDITVMGTKDMQYLVKEVVSNMCSVKKKRGIYLYISCK